MRITADTNILVRAITEDDAAQARVAQAELAGAEIVALSLPALCELVWVLNRAYHIDRDAIAAAVRGLVDADNASVDRPAVDAGLTMLDAGGDFADGVIAYAGRWLGADTFVSFDQKAISRLQLLGEPARLPG